MIELKTCSYKGVEFLFDSLTATGGNRLVKFNYPGSDKQSIEKQGKAPPTFSISAIIPHDNYYFHRDNLLRVLNDGDSGIMLHPTFGEIENVINGIFTLVEKITELGRATITIPFEIDDAKGIPIQAAQLETQVIAEAELFNAQMEKDIDNYSVNASLAGNFKDAEDQLADISSAFDKASDTTAETTEKAANLTKSLKAFNDNARTLISNPVTAKTKLSSSIIGLFTEIGSTLDLPQDIYDAYKSMFDFGLVDKAIKESTYGRIERARNRKLLVAGMQSLALSYGYVSAVQNDYSSTESLDLAHNELEGQYARVREVLSNEALEQMDRLRVQALKTLDNARVQVRRVITIETKRRPLSVLLYAYYGHTDLFDVIAEMNNIKQNAFVEGEVKLLSWN